MMPIALRPLESRRNGLRNDRRKPTMRKPRRAVRPCIDRLDDRCLPSGLTVAQLTHAYGLDAIAFPSASGQRVAGDGSGETIALIEAYHDPSLGSDLHVFDQANGLADPSLSVVDQAGARTNLDWASEESLDVEWAHAIAPGAGILVVEARSDSLSDLVQAAGVARDTPGVVAVSMSWGFNEAAGQAAYDAGFRTPAGHQGITFVAASGDEGTLPGPEYPSSSPNVLAVGGTTLATDLAGDYLAETVWSGSGGGYSPYEPEPRYQKSVQRTGHRSTPDVAFDADPNSGVEVYETLPGSSTGMWVTVGGTSLGAPAWAAIIAIVDQGRALQGKGSLDGPTQTLPALYSLPATDFNTIGALPPYSPWGGGINPVGSPPYGGAFLRYQGKTSAGSSTGSASRANIATGLGSPVGPSLIAGLVASDITLPSTKSGAHIASHAHASTRSTRHVGHPNNGRQGPLHAQ
jgi:subtilase family serine protease